MTDTTNTTDFDSTGTPNLTALREACDWFLNASPREINDRFASLPGAVRIRCYYQRAKGQGERFDTDAIWVPPTRKDNVLLVAHSDTVWGDDGNAKPTPGQIAWDAGTTAFSTDLTKGIGGDDRAGCAALWALRDSGHGLLVVPYEEVGCLGSAYIASGLAKPLRSKVLACNYMLQFDRRGSRDIVTYGCDNKMFVRKLQSYLIDYSWQSGSFSDIAELMPAAGVAGANVSIGFRHEHTPEETLDLLDFARTVARVRELLADETKRYSYLMPQAHPNYPLLTLLTQRYSVLIVMVM